MSHMATPKKRQASRERKGKSLNVWIDARIRDAVDMAVAQSHPRSSLKYVVEALLETGLREMGLLPSPLEEP